MGCCSSKPTFQNQSADAPQTKKDASTQTQTTQTTQTKQAEEPEPMYISPSCQSIINIFREDPAQPSGPDPSDPRTWRNNPNTPYFSCRVWGGSSESTPEARAAREQRRQFNVRNARALEEEDYRMFGSVPELPANFRRQDRSWCSEESDSDW